MKNTLTQQLKTLIMGGALAVSANSASSAVAVNDPGSTQSPIDVRVSKVLTSMESGSQASTNFGEGVEKIAPGTMWWGNGGWRRGWGNGFRNGGFRNGWHNGGFRNGWHNGWGNGFVPGIHINL
jgi:rSAM-associated Gly-rich repeat protein